MNERMKTSKKTHERLEAMQKSLKFSTKAALARIAIGYSLRFEGDPRQDEEFLIVDNSGFEFQRSTLTGDQDYIYKIMVIQHINKHIEDSEYYPKLLKAHLERGLKYLYSEFQYLGNRDKFFDFLLKVK